MPMMNPMGWPEPKMAKAAFFHFPGGKYEDIMLTPDGTLESTTEWL